MTGQELQYVSYSPVKVATLVSDTGSSFYSCSSVTTNAVGCQVYDSTTNSSFVARLLIPSGKAIETTAVPKVTERVHAALLEEMTLEDRINDEVRVILEAYSEEMNKTGANYQEMFRKVKSELVRKYKAVL